MNNRVSGFSFVDLFAGIGGMRLAFEGAGGQCVFSCERDRWARATYEANFGAVEHEDIRTLNPLNLPAHHVMVAGFPCQPFSIAGVSKKGALGRAHGFRDDDQGTLFFVLEDLIRAAKPEVVVLENVRGLKSHNRGRTLKWIVRRLRSAGYFVDDRLVQGSHYVPQNRLRLFIVATRQAPFTFPSFDGIHPRPKLRDILESNPDPKFTLTDRLWAYLRAYAEKHRLRGNGFGFGLADPEGITRTLSARYHKDGAEILIPQEGKNPRRLTPHECKLLMGFPSDFKMPVSNSQAYRQLGNSVVVPAVADLALAVGEYVRDIAAGPGDRRTMDAPTPLEVGCGELPAVRLASHAGPVPGADRGDDGSPDTSGAGGKSLAGVH